jgi:hypothetical protein
MIIPNGTIVRNKHTLYGRYPQLEAHTKGVIVQNCKEKLGHEHTRQDSTVFYWIQSEGYSEMIDLRADSLERLRGS